MVLNIYESLTSGAALALQPRGGEWGAGLCVGGAHPIIVNIKLQISEVYNFTDSRNFRRRNIRRTEFWSKNIGLKDY